MGERATVHVTVLQATGLVAKDRNMFGKKTTSDPYIECFMTYTKNDGTAKTFGRKVGQTETKYKTLNPTYNHTFETIEFVYAENPTIQLRIFDEDKLSEPDAMGMIKIPIHTSRSNDTTEWYDVPNDSAKNASGKVQVRIQVDAYQILPYVTKQTSTTNTTSSSKTTTSSKKKKGAPERFIKVNGVVKLNPKYVKWKEKQG